MNNSFQLIIQCQDDHSDQELPDEQSLRQQCWHHSEVQGGQTLQTGKKKLLTLKMGYLSRASFSVRSLMLF